MKKTVLIYDDDPEILFLCKTILTKNQYRCETLSTCENVISDIEQIQPDIILMDLWIPEIGGEKAVTLVKANESTRHIPVILFSANAKLKEISREVNAQGYIEKPFDLAVFLETIEQNILRSEDQS